VGLKLCLTIDVAEAQEPSLNRTSVGLKPTPDKAGRRPATAPQSNQRGIETRASFVVGLNPNHASIEPAWD